MYEVAKILHPFVIINEKPLLKKEKIDYYDDKLNDVLLPKGTGWVLKNYLFEVYNRWGKRIFKTTDLSQGWDGKLQETSIDPIGVYFWRVNITDNIDEIHELKGHVTVLR